MCRLIDAPDSDLFDVLAYVRFTMTPKTRTERADAVRSSDLTKEETEMRDFLLGVLQAYAKNGESELRTSKLGDFLAVRYGSMADAKRVLGETAEIRRAYLEMQRHLYEQ